MNELSEQIHSSKAVNKLKNLANVQTLPIRLGKNVYSTYWERHLLTKPL